MHLQDEFAERGVCPGEPGTGEFFRVVLVKSLMHEAGARMRPLQGIETKTNFAVVSARQSPLDELPSIWGIGGGLHEHLLQAHSNHCGASARGKSV